MAYVPPIVPQRETFQDTTFTQEDQRLFTRGNSAITANTPDAKVSYFASRRFGLYCACSQASRLHGPIWSPNGPETKTVSIPPGMFREFVAGPDPVIEGQEQTYSFMVTPAQKDDTIGMHFEDDKGHRFPNSRTAIFQNATVSASNGSGVIVTPDKPTGYSDE